MKIKNIVQVFLLGIICIICVAFLNGCSKSSKSINFSNGNYKDNMYDFAEPITYNSESPIVDSYFKNVSYTIESIDKENQKLVLNVSTPDVSSILEETINESITENGESDYETLLALTKDKLEDKLNAPEHAVISKQIELEICQDSNHEWKMVLNDEFYNFIAEPFLSIMEEG